MSNLPKKAVSSTANFISRHRMPIAITTTAVTTAYVVKKTIGAQLAYAKEFIQEEGLLEKFQATFEDQI